MDYVNSQNRSDECNQVRQYWVRTYRFFWIIFEESINADLLILLLLYLIFLLLLLVPVTANKEVMARAIGPSLHRRLLHSWHDFEFVEGALMT
jgi:hypothetical protein